MLGMFNSVLVGLKNNSGKPWVLAFIHTPLPWRHLSWYLTLTCGGTDTGRLGVSCGVRHWSVGGGFFKSCSTVFGQSSVWFIFGCPNWWECSVWPTAFTEDHSYCIQPIWLFVMLYLYIRISQYCSNQLLDITYLQTLPGYIQLHHLLQAIRREINQSIKRVQSFSLLRWASVLTHSVRWSGSVSWTEN